MVVVIGAWAVLLGAFVVVPVVEVGTLMLAMLLVGVSAVLFDLQAVAEQVEMAL